MSGEASLNIDKESKRAVRCLLASRRDGQREQRRKEGGRRGDGERAEGEFLSRLQQCEWTEPRARSIHAALYSASTQTKLAPAIRRLFHTLLSAWSCRVITYHEYHTLFLVQSRAHTANDADNANNANARNEMTDGAGFPSFWLEMSEKVGFLL